MSWDAFIYFVKPQALPGPFKVGFSADPDRRMREVKMWSPLPLEVAAVLLVENAIREWDWRDRMSGKGVIRCTELAFHRRYRPYRLHGEWFRVHDLLTSDVEAIRAGAFDLADLGPLVRKAA